MRNSAAEIPDLITDCIFCQIVAGQAPASIVYRDEVVMAFMDLYPISRGHTLVIPVTHAENLAKLQPATGAHLFEVAMRLSNAVREATRCDGINLFVANGAAAGQDVFHFHLHILPRTGGDQLGLKHPPGYPREESRQTLDVLATAIKQTHATG